MADEEETFLRHAPEGENSIVATSGQDKGDDAPSSSAGRPAKGKTSKVIRNEPDVSVRQPQSSRYGRALSTLWPVRCSKQPEDTLPLDSTGLLNYITFGWLTPYIWRVYRKGAEEVQGLHMRDKESSDVAALRMGKFWQEELDVRGPKQASFGRVMFRAFRTRIILVSICMILSALLVLAIPAFVIRYFLEYLSEGDVSVGSGIGYAFLLAGVILLHSLLGGFSWMVNFEAAARIKYGSLALLYKKVLRVKNFRDKSVGDVVNFISNDGQRVWDAIVMGPFIIGTPVLLIFSCIYSIVLLGPWALVGWAFTVGFVPFMATFAKMSMKFREVSIKLTDKRVGFTNELLTCIKLIKMYAWEECFSQKIIDVRAAEKQILEKSVFAQSVAMGTSMLIPIFASCLTFVAYVGTGNNLTATEAFTFVSLLNTMQGSLLALPFSLKAVSEVMVTVTRMNWPSEFEPYSLKEASTNVLLEVGVENRSLIQI